MRKTPRTSLDQRGSQVPDVSRKWIWLETEVGTSPRGTGARRLPWSDLVKSGHVGRLDLPARPLCLKHRNRLLVVVAALVFIVLRLAGTMREVFEYRHALFEVSRLFEFGRCAKNRDRCFNLI